MNKYILLTVLSCFIVACEKEEQKSRELGEQAGAQVKQVEAQINKIAQDNIDKYRKADELTQ